MPPATPAARRKARRLTVDVRVGEGTWSAMGVTLLWAGRDARTRRGAKCHGTYTRASASARPTGHRRLTGSPDRRYRGCARQALARAHLTTATAMCREMDMRFWLEKAEAETAGLAGVRSAGPRRPEKLTGDREEVVEAVVVEPVPRPRDADDARVAEGLGAPILERVPGPALLAVQQQGGTVDPRPQELDVAARHVVGRPGAHVVVELPAIGAVLVLVDTLGGQVPRLLRGEMRVLLLHPAEGLLDRRVAPGHPAGEVALLADPLVHALGNGLLATLGQDARRGAESFDGDQLRHRLWIDAGVAERDVAAERVGDDRDRGQPLLVDELGEVVDIAGHRVAPIRRPLAVAMAPQVGRDHVPVVPERGRGPVPVPAVITPAVDQEQRRLAGIAPVHAVQPQPLGEVHVRRRSRCAVAHRVGAGPSASDDSEGCARRQPPTACRVQGRDSKPVVPPLARASSRWSPHPAYGWGLPAADAGRGLLSWGARSRTHSSADGAMSCHEGATSPRAPVPMSVRRRPPRGPRSHPVIETETSRMHTHERAKATTVSHHDP